MRIPIFQMRKLSLKNLEDCVQVRAANEGQRPDLDRSSRDLKADPYHYTSASKTTAVMRSVFF